MHHDPPKDGQVGPFGAVLVGLDPGPVSHRDTRGSSHMARSTALGRRKGSFELFKGFSLARRRKGDVRNSAEPAAVVPFVR